MLVFAEKGGGGVFLREILSYVVDGVWVEGWLPGVFARFCALLLRFSALFGASARGESGTIFRMFSSMGFALWTVASILRFWGRIAGRIGAAFLAVQVVDFVGVLGSHGSFLA